MRKIKTMLPFLTGIVLNYYLLTSIMGTGPIILLAVVPSICFICSIVYGINNSFSILYAVFVAVLFTPSVIVIHIFVPFALVLAFGYGMVALLGNAVGTKYFKHKLGIKKSRNCKQYLLFAVVGSYIVAVIVSAIMMSQMTQITYSASAFGRTIREDVIDFKANTALRKYWDFNGKLERQEEYSIDTTKKISSNLKCVFSLFPLWGDYHNSYILDGGQYSITRSYGKCESIVSGSNAYPLTLKLQSKCSPL